MTKLAMQRVKINDTALEILDKGAGEPIVFVHGAMGDECAAVLKEPALADHYRLIHYYRRGWGDSERPDPPPAMPQQAADCRAVMHHLGVERAHLVGQSDGGVVVLQVALDFPETVQSLALLEPAVPSLIFNAPAFSAVLAKVVALYEAGDKAGAMDVFGREVIGENYRTVLDQTLPAGYFERWVADADTIFQYEGAGFEAWTFTPTEAALITQPVLNMRGANTQPYFREIYETIQQWLSHAEHVILPNATHAMLQTNPKGAAERLADFFARNSISG